MITDEDGQPIIINRKNITGEVTGNADFNFDDVIPEKSPLAPGSLINAEPQEEELNPLVDLVDVGLDFAEETLQDMGYPALKRKAWDEHGKKALSKAINTYAPPGSSLGGTIDTPIFALLVGLGALMFCFLPVFQKFMKDRAVIEEKRQARIEAETEQQEQDNITGELQGVYETPIPSVPSSTAPISESMLSAMQRVERLG